jgi:uncharacterized repeat protein (TIGR03803 family)
MVMLKPSTIVCIVVTFCAATAMASPAPATFTKLYTFCRETKCADGLLPFVGVVQGADGNLYGTTAFGGNSACYPPNGCGTVFKITTDGKLTTLYTFCPETNCADGDEPDAQLLLATDGNFYGTTLYGGADSSGCGGLGCGTVFKITAAGKLTTLYGFCAESNCSDGSQPHAALVQATDGTLYGTTALGGDHNDGTVFKISRSGKLTTLYSFCSQTDCTDGSDPGPLVQASDGNFYGTTYGGGADSSGCSGLGCGTVFKISAAGQLITLYSFCSETNCADGAIPWVAFLPGTDGNFYGTTLTGGDLSCSIPGGCGTVYKITPEGKLTTLHSIHGNEGYAAEGGLVQATDGNFYGGTGVTFCNKKTGTCNSVNTLFKMTPTGRFTTLYRRAKNCEIPNGLVQATNGTLYGTAASLDLPGTVFSLYVGLGSFVQTNPTSGKLGTKVTILGNSLSGATSVTFNGTAAKFRIVSDTEVRTSVPACAATGFVTVTTPKKTLKSNAVFRVTK